MMPIRSVAAPIRFLDLLAAGVMAVLSFGPLACGAVMPWSIFVLEQAAAVLLLAWFIHRTCWEAPPVLRTQLYFPAAAFALLVIVQLLSHSTVYTYETRAVAWQYAAYGAVALVAIDVFRDSRLSSRFISVMTALGAMLALFAIVQDLTTRRLYFIGGSYPGLFGPYVNHNH